MRVLDLSARQLRAFLAVGREGNITRAAHTLGLTPSPVGRALREFEEAVQETLFLRDNRVTTMTEAADRLLPFVVSALALLEGLTIRTPKSLRVGAADDVSDDWKKRLLECVSVATGQAAELEVRAEHELVSALQFGEIDLVLTPEALEATGLESRHLGESTPAVLSEARGVSLSWRAFDALNIEMIGTIVEAAGGAKPDFPLGGEVRTTTPTPARSARKLPRVAADASIDIADLRMMVAVSRHRNLRAAAESLGLTSSPVGRTLRDVESEFGAPLFERENHDFVPTALMKDLLPRAVEVLALVDAMAPGEAMLRVGVSLWVPVRYRDRLLQGAAAAGSPPIEIVEAPQPELLAQLVHGEVDLLVLNSWRDLPDVAQRRLGVLQFHVFSAGEPVTTNATATLADLGDRTVISLPRSTAPGMYPRLAALVGADRVYEPTTEQLLTIDSRMHRTGAVIFAAGVNDTALRHLLERPGIVSVPMSGLNMAAVNVDAVWRRLDLVRAHHLKAAFRMMQPADGSVEQL